MALAAPIYTVDRPNQKNKTGDVQALAIEEFTGVVEGTIKRRSFIENFIPLRTVKGTSTITNYAIGEATLQALVPGQVPDGTPVDQSRITVTVDTTVISRNALPLLESFQTNYDVRKELGTEQGKKISKFYDESFFIQAAKAAALTTSPYGSAGHGTGNTVTLGAAADATDPAKLYQAISDLFVKFEQQDVSPQDDDIVIVVPPAQFYALQDAQQIINGEYITADGNKIEGQILKAFGVMVKSSNNVPAGKNITSHFLSNTANGNAYNGDFTKLVAQAFSARALLAGATIPLQTNVFFDDISKVHFVDSWLAYAVTPNRPEFAGAIYIP